jgi:transcription elongation factor Elf1
MEIVHVAQKPGEGVYQISCRKCQSVFRCRPEETGAYHYKRVQDEWTLTLLHRVFFCPVCGASNEVDFS